MRVLYAVASLTLALAFAAPSTSFALTVCTTNTQCDDNNVCTIDVCNRPSGSASGTCVITTIPDCCNTTADCNDGDSCTTDTCDLGNHTCSHVAAANCCQSDTDCDDNTVCTADKCNLTTHTCSHPAIAGCCTDDNACDDGELCTFDHCDMATHSCRNRHIPGCCTADAECADTNACTADTCDLQFNQCQHDFVPGCCNTNPQCNDGNSCTVDTCDTSTHTCLDTPITGCCTMDGDCNDANACTQDSCPAGTGARTCVNQAIPGCCTTNSQCNDGNICTADSCNAAHGCDHAQIPGCCMSDTQCDDGDQCTTDSCDMTSHSCQHTAVPSCGGCQPGPGSDCCNNDGDCNDHRDCTTDRCELSTHTCTHDDVPNCCQSNFDCLDGDICTFDRCDPQTNTCVHLSFPNCCMSDAICMDNSACTTDTCDTSDGTCHNTPIANCCMSRQDCDDNDSCTRDRCSMQTHTCTHEAMPGCCSTNTDCDDNNPCTIDSCDPQAQTCTNTPIPSCMPGGDAGLGGDAQFGPDGGTVGPNGLDLGGGGCGGCESGGNAGGTIALGFIVFGALARRRRLGAVLGMMILCFAATRARADGFDAELYQAATSSSGYLTQEGAQVLPVDQFDAGASFDFAYHPLVARDPATGDALAHGNVIANRLGMQLVAGYGLARWLEVGLAVPMILAENGDTLMDHQGLSTTALGDIRLFGKAAIWSRGSLAFAGALDASIPTGNTESFAGGAQPTLRPRLVFGWYGERASVAADLGYRIQGRNQIANIVVDDEITAGLAGSFALRPAKLWLLGEAFLAAGVMGNGHDVPAELLLGLRAMVYGGWQGQVALGEGLGHGYGTPGFQAVLSARYTADFAKLLRDPPKPKPVKPPPPPPVDLDPDHDGIINPIDQCPNDPEDKDGFQDEDGCPDLDNDADGIPDAKDKCPNEPEDMDHFQDEDGCPELDNDADGIPDNKDACPNDPETKNGYQDDDGCPDEIPDKVKHFTGEVQKIAFKLGSSELLPVSKKVLDKAILLMSEFPDLTLQIVGHTDDQPLGKGGKFADNEALSQARAESVRAYFTSHGVDESRLFARGMGATEPLEDPTGLKGGKLAAARAKNRRVEFVVGRPTPPAPTP